MKIPSSNQVREVLKQDVPKFNQFADELQGVAISAYRMGYWDACKKASEIAEAAERGIAYLENVDMMDEICGNLKPVKP